VDCQTEPGPGSGEREPNHLAGDIRFTGAGPCGRRRQRAGYRHRSAGSAHCASRHSAQIQNVGLGTDHYDRQAGRICLPDSPAGRLCSQHRQNRFCLGRSGRYGGLGIISHRSYTTCAGTGACRPDGNSAGGNHYPQYGHSDDARQSRRYRAYSRAPIAATVSP
jgi:hypothetical protein